MHLARYSLSPLRYILLIPTFQVETQKLDWKAKSKIGSMDNANHHAGGGERKVCTPCVISIAGGGERKVCTPCVISIAGGMGEEGNLGSCTGRASARGPGWPATHGPGRARLQGYFAGRAGCGPETCRPGPGPGW